MPARSTLTTLGGPLTYCVLLPTRSTLATLGAHSPTAYYCLHSLHGLHWLHSEPTHFLLRTRVPSDRGHSFGGGGVLRSGKCGLVVQVEKALCGVSVCSVSVVCGVSVCSVSVVCGVSACGEHSVRVSV
jgi:hypothetical protein